MATANQNIFTFHHAFRHRFYVCLVLNVRLDADHNTWKRRKHFVRNFLTVFSVIIVKLKMADNYKQQLYSKIRQTRL